MAMIQMMDSDANARDVKATEWANLFINKLLLVK
jgi:hypothetical protein